MWRALSPKTLLIRFLHPERGQALEETGQRDLRLTTLCRVAAVLRIGAGNLLEAREDAIPSFDISAFEQLKQAPVMFDSTENHSGSLFRSVSGRFDAACAPAPGKAVGGPCGSFASHDT
jgi:hypothetical protein